MVNSMAATNRNRSHPDDPLYEKTRAQIQTTQLIKRMNANSLGELKPEMTAGQIATARVLVDKVLPNLTASDITHSVDDVLADKIAKARIRNGD